MKRLRIQPFNLDRAFLRSLIHPGLTEAPADVDVEVDAVVAVVHQEAVAHLDQRAEVVLLPVCVEHVTRHLRGGKPGFEV